MKEQISRFFGGLDNNGTDEIKMIPLHDIEPNRYQPRTVFDDHKLDELCQTIRTHGVIQPIVVRPQQNGTFELIAGERRWRASLKLELDTIPAIVRDLNESQAASVALIENLQREGLTAIEEAIAYQKLIDNHQLTQESLAQRLGKGQSTIANKLRLLHLGPACQDALRQRFITERHARALLSIKNHEEQERYLEFILRDHLNVKQTEHAIESYLNPQKNKSNQDNDTSVESTPTTRLSERKKVNMWKNYTRDTRLAINTIRESVSVISKSGMSVNVEEEDREEYIQFTIKIPK